MELEREKKKIINVFFKKLFIYFIFGGTGSLLLAYGLFLVALSKGYSSLLWCKGLSCSAHVGSSQARDKTYVPCTGRQILNHQTTSKAPNVCF